MDTITQKKRKRSGDDDVDNPTTTTSTITKRTTNNAGSSTQTSEEMQGEMNEQRLDHNAPDDLHSASNTLTLTNLFSESDSEEEDCTSSQLPRIYQNKSDREDVDYTSLQLALHENKSKDVTKNIQLKKPI